MRRRRLTRWTMTMMAAALTAASCWSDGDGVCGGNPTVCGVLGSNCSGECAQDPACNHGGMGASGALENLPRCATEDDCRRGVCQAGRCVCSARNETCVEKEHCCGFIAPELISSFPLLSSQSEVCVAGRCVRAGSVPADASADASDADVDARSSRDSSSLTPSDGSVDALPGP